MTDVVVVGSGAGGGPLALRLSEAGFDVLVLERGPRHERTDHRHDEVDASAYPERFVPTLREDPRVLVDHGDSAPAPRLTTLGWTACCVGGGTARMGGSLFRFHPDDFRLRSHLGAFHGIEDWPYTYAELEPYYALAEWEVGVAGRACAHPFEGFRSRGYPMPPLQSNAFGAELDRACSRLGLHPFPTPRAINSRPYGGRPACELCDQCAGYGCPVGARGSSAEALLPRAVATGRCEVRAGAMVREVTVGPDGRATGCVYLDASGVEHRVRARVVCLCASAVETARLLLLSTSPRFPHGLANGSGQVGRSLQFHTSSAGRARFRYDRHPGKGLRDRNPFLGRSVMDHYFLPPGASTLAKGGTLRFDMERAGPIARALRAARTAGGGWLWGEPLRRALAEHFHDAREVEFEAFHDFIPSAGTYVELDPEVRDRWGLPVARIHLSPLEHHRTAGEWLVARGLEVLYEAGADEATARGVGYVNDVMAQGTCRAGSDPSRHVLNGFCQSHEVPNLFVADGSFMPTSGGVPTTLTILANSFRTADYIANRARSGELG
jgi:choline dehydrogenase-like flavoprotein